MPERWVVNASPLIVLCKVDHQHLIAQLAEQVAIPQAVADEICVGPEDDPARQFLSRSPFPVVGPILETAIVSWDLGAGETAVLSYAIQNPDWTAVVDDGAARRCARTLAVPLLGTLGIILRARQKNIIPAAVPVLKLLQKQGFRVDERLLRTVLPNTVGEAWE